MALLELKDLHTFFRTKKGIVKAVNGVSYSVEAGRTLGVVGESGSGKSVSAMSILQLLDGNGYIDSGEILFEGRDLTKLTEKEMYSVRGNDISVIFQEPMTSLNPVFRCGYQIDEVIKLHNPELHKDKVRERSIEMLKLVGIANAEGVYSMFPHELSGGMRQRVMIAMALSCNPKLLIADEPTTALDVTIQAQILRLMRQLTHDFNTSVILITHDMGVVAEMADHVMVMYAGKDVEYGTLEQIFDHPLHPYTNGLLRSIPRINQRKDERLYTIDGTVPTLDEMPKGCRFCTRCKEATQRCWEQDPGMHTLADGHKVRCWKYVEEGGSTDGSSAAGNP